MNCFLKGDGGGFHITPGKGNEKLKSIPTIINNKKLTINNELLYSHPVSDEAKLIFQSLDVKAGERECLNKSAILLSEDRLEVFFEGPWHIESFSLPQVTTLAAFLNYQAQSPDDGEARIRKRRTVYPVLLNTQRNFISVVENDEKTLLKLLVSNMLYDEMSCTEDLLSFICSTESYWIAYFLLSQVMDENAESDACKLYNACKMYGVSESHFRKLCHNVFTCGPKKQLRMWRAAHSALQLIEKDNSIAMVAGNNGYSSSSHFSSEIKSFFGITPRDFKKMGIFLHEQNSY
ncbi:helix-turn-helix domain-containing protein [Erwinia psidii]|nr:helix-turn-helix domain-containing protein [Erwinia psidii]